MVPEFTVLISSLIGLLVSGYLLTDAALDRIAILRIEKEDGIPKDLDSFTRNRGISETIRFIILLAWFLAAIIAIVGRGAIRETIVWILALIPVLVTAGSIHSWWMKKRWERARDLEGLRHR